MIELVQKGEPVLFRPVNWNSIPDPLDKLVWDQLNKQFWLDTNFPVSNDLKSWAGFTEDEKWLVMRVFTGLTLLDTLQGHVGAPALVEDAVTDQEVACLRQIAFMEEVHAKSYSTIFQTLATSDQIERAFRWSEENDHLQEKARIIYRYYRGADHLKRKVASVFLESFLFYSGFFLPLYLNGQARLTNTADLIRTIIRDESVHGTYIGRKFQNQFENLNDEAKAELTEWSFDLLDELYENEAKYTEDLYDDHNLTEEVKKFLRYNANKALMNLGFDPLYPKEEVMAIVMNSLDESNETHDFFSTTGNYTMGEKKATSDKDWDLDSWDDNEDW